MIQAISTIRGRLSLAAILWAGACTAALSAEAAKPAVAAETAPKTATVSEVVVTAARREEPGSVPGDIQPEIQLAPEDIAAYGVSSISDLLDELAPQISSGRGRGGEGPVILLNGRRISGFQEIRDIPTEAILRAEILPEEAGLKLGYSADQRVVNIVLKPHFRSETAELSGGGPTAGGNSSLATELGATRIADSYPLNLDLKYSRQTALTEADRNLTSLSAGQLFDPVGNVLAAAPGGEIDPALSRLAGQVVTVAGVPAVAATRAPTLSDFLASANLPNSADARAFRTLAPDTDKFSANAVFSRQILGGVKATLNGTFEATSSDSLQGLPGVALAVPAGDPFSPFAGPVLVNRSFDAFGPLTQSADSRSGHLGVSLNKDVANWRYSLTGAYDHGETSSSNVSGIDASALQTALAARAANVNPFGLPPANLLALRAPDTSESTSNSGNVQFLASGPLFKVPAGQARTSLRLGATASDFSSESKRFGVTQTADFSRSGFNGRFNLDVPLASKRANVLPFLGELTANANVALDRASDYGTLVDYGYGLNWQPVTGLRLRVSRVHDEAAPTQAQLGAPLVLTPGVRLFDFQTGATVDVIQVGGGNPALTDDARDQTAIGGSYQPWADKQFTLIANYTKSRIRDPIATFPAATADIEAAFPDRFTRNAQGVLVQVDYRPVNFAAHDRSSLRWGFNYSKPIGPKTAPQPRGRGPAAILSRLPGAGAPQNAPAEERPEGARPAEPAGDGGPPPGAFAGGPPAGGGGFGGGGGPGGGRGPGGGGRGGGGTQDGRLTFSLFHTVILDDQILVRPGGPVIDLLNGGALGGSGGEPRHEVEARLGVSERGFGGQLSLDWKSATFVRGAPGSRTGDLDFSDLATVDLRLFADLNQRKALIQKAPWLKGGRLTISVSNLFDQRVDVRDATGATPLSFQPDYLDPIGRSWRIGFRKLFS